MAARSALVRIPPIVAVLGFILLAAPAQASGAGLTPFAGETVEEFEARKKGRRLEKAPVQIVGAVVVPADQRGHFLVEPSVNGRRLRMLVDTGASAVALSYEDAVSAGFHVAASDFTISVQTANGPAKAAPIRIGEIEIGDITVRGVPAVVARPGALNVSLLGMTFLKRLGGFEVAQGRLTMR